MQKFTILYHVLEVVFKYEIPNYITRLPMKILTLLSKFLYKQPSSEEERVRRARQNS